MEVDRKIEEGNMDALAIIKGVLDAKKPIEARTLDRADTAIFVIDMLKGFTEEGALADGRIGSIAEPISKMIDKLPRASVVFLNDAHGPDSAEFGGYPEHCVKGTVEAEIVDVLKKHAERGMVIEKNSTNGFVGGAFQKWFKDNEAGFSTYIITGDCTDICIKQFALTLKAWFNERNRMVRVIVPMDLVETFDLKPAGHDAGLMNLISIYEMDRGGIEIASALK